MDYAQNKTTQVECSDIVGKKNLKGSICHFSTLSAYAIEKYVPYICLSERQATIKHLNYNHTNNKKHALSHQVKGTARIKQWQWAKRR